MKKIFVLLFAAVMAASCLGDGTSSSHTYNLIVDFEYAENVFEADSVAFDDKQGLGIGYADLAFFHKLTADKKTLVGGFAVSRLKGKGSSLGRNDFRVNSGAGLAGSPTYAVFKYDPNAQNMPEHDVQFLNKQYGTCTMKGCYVNNTAEVVQAVRSVFEVGDRLTLKATGYLDGAKTGDAEISLADYSAQKDSVVVNWTAFDLSKLGTVEFVEFEIVSTKEDVPASFCMDNMISTIALKY